ncbi:MAG: transcriptional regulator [Thermodesulfobacteriota bacterium]
MSKVILTVSSRKDVTARALAAFRGETQGAVISFSSPELLWQTLSKKRWELLKAMVGRGPLTIRGLAREVERDVKGVHSDIHRLLNAGLVERTDTGQVLFPYDAVHVDFELQAA